MTTVSKVLEIAKNEVGYCRYDDPERGTKYGRWYADLVGDKAFGANGVAYCAMFASWVLAKAGVECDGMPGAYCPSIHHKQTLKAADLKAGDLVLFDWENDDVDDHIGIVVSNDKAAKTVKTIEGNTSGGRVAERTRAYSTICGGIRPKYGKAQAAEPAAKEITRALVADVADGKWGNDPGRSEKLRAEGYDPKAVQLAVNAYLRGESFGAAKPAGEKSAKYKIVTPSGVNVRRGAGTSNPKTGKVYSKGKEVAVTQTKKVGSDLWGKTSDGWFAIQYNGSIYAKKC